MKLKVFVLISIIIPHLTAGESNLLQLQRRPLFLYILHVTQFGDK